MAVLSDTVSMVESWSDGDFGFDDITGPVSVGMDLLSAALDPVGALIAAPLGELLNFMVHHISFISEPLAKLEGSDDLVNQQAEAWNSIANEFVTAGNHHADGANDLAKWQGPAADSYRDIMKATNGVFGAVSQAANRMGMGVQAAGALVGTVRGLIWDLITDLLTKAIEGAIVALAAAIPSFGTSLAAFAGWYTTQVGAIGVKVFKYIDELLGRAEKFTSKCKMLNDQVKKARKYCKDIIKQLTAAQRYAGRTMNPTATKIPKRDRRDEVPKGSLPGDTTAPHRTDHPVKAPPAARGPLEAPDPDVAGTLKDYPKGAAKDVGKKAGSIAWDENTNDDPELRTL